MPTSGRPLSFLEMPQAASIEIWQRSINAAEALGPLAAHVVSAHFTTLLQNAGARWSADPRQFQIARQFLDEHSENRERWLSAWQQPDPTRRTRKVVDRALHYLQFFDMLSLWLCGADRYEPETVTTPEGAELTFQPRGVGRFADAAVATGRSALHGHRPGATRPGRPLHLVARRWRRGRFSSMNCNSNSRRRRSARRRERLAEQSDIKGQAPPAVASIRPAGTSYP